MEFLLFITASASFALWAIVLILPWQPWRNREAWEANKNLRQSLSDVTVLMPARNESLVIQQTLKAVAQQGPDLKVILVDDQSTDRTADLAQEIVGENIRILRGQSRPEGWSGKLWALEQGRQEVNTPYLMLLDADVAIAPGVVSGLKQRLIQENRDFISLMAKPPLKSFWEKLLMPAFIYFFKLLYPFHLANSSNPWVAAAAGGCVMTKAKVLEKIGGFASIKDEVIDDCALARHVKQKGYSTWVGLTHSVRSVRPYKNLQEIWDMVARTAYNQLRYSLALLLLCTFLMFLSFIAPIALLVFGYQEPWVQYLSLGALVAMLVAYLPTLWFYHLSLLWSLLLPLVGTMFLGMTWTSAIRYWRGEQLRWRGRVIKRI